MNCDCPLTIVESATTSERLQYFTMIASGCQFGFFELKGVQWRQSHGPPFSRVKTRSLKTPHPCTSPTAQDEPQRCVQIVGALADTAGKQERTDEARNAAAQKQPTMHRRKS